MAPDDGRPPVTPLRTPREVEPRLPPVSIDAEQALLGAILINNAAHGRVAEFLRAEHFSNAVHGRLYAATAKLIERGQNANPVTLKTLFDQDGALAGIGGAQYLARLAAAAVTIINAEDYGHIIHDLFLRRRLIGLGEEVVNDAFSQDLDDPARAQIERAEAALYRLAEGDGADGGARPLATALNAAIREAEAAFRRGGRTAGVATGFIDLDRILGGLHPSDLIVLAGRPAMGKSALAADIAVNAARDRLARPEEGAAGLVYSLEMGAAQIATRLLGAESGIGGDRIRRGALGHADFETFVALQPGLSALPLFIDDTPALGLAQIAARARRLKRRHGLGLVVVDYLQLVEPDRKGEGRVNEVGAISRGLKALAKELQLPVLALSQLSRAVEGREDHRPLLSDLRDSGTIEQDADVVLFLYRPEYYAARGEPDIAEAAKHRAWAEGLARAAGRAEVLVAKNRNGPIGAVTLRFDPARTHFDNFANHAPERGLEGGAR